MPAKETVIAPSPGKSDFSAPCENIKLPGKNNIITTWILLIIASLDSGGTAGIQADLKVNPAQAVFATGNSPVLLKSVHQ